MWKKKLFLLNRVMIVTQGAFGDYRWIPLNCSRWLSSYTMHTRMHKHACYDNLLCNSNKQHTHTTWLGIFGMIKRSTCIIFIYIIWDQYGSLWTQSSCCAMPQITWHLWCPSVSSPTTKKIKIIKLTEQIFSKLFWGLLAG